MSNHAERLAKEELIAAEGSRALSPPAFRAVVWVVPVQSGGELCGAPGGYCETPAAGDDIARWITKP